MPRVRADECVIVKGEGAYVWDEQGNRMLDGPAGLWYCNVGHGRAELAQAAAAQMERIASYSNFQRMATRPAIDLAERLIEIAPIDDGKVFLGSGGSDMVDFAAKLARRTWQVRGRPQKLTLVTRKQAYHGLHGYGTSIAGLEPNRLGFGPLLEETARVPHSDAEALAALIAERGAETIAAFYCEPVMGTGGVILPPDGYLRRVEQICRENDILFIVDEVITGFGRVGTTFASERFDLTPDVLLTAKGITSGYQPLGAAVVSRELWEPFWAPDSELIFHHGITYSGHATACAVALANLDIIEREGLVARVAELEPLLEAALLPLESHELVKEVRTGVGLLGGVEPIEPALGDRIAAACIERGLLIRTITDGTVQVSPPFVVTDDDIEFIGATLAEALDAVAEAA
ncbi:MAG: aspartate aminotransferase family protein [Actinobacteria bacterium]|nr:aspartate aminotransferase family protein [Actinomycetota bacterium]